MKKIKSILVLLFLVISIFANAQIEIYRTYEDYQKKNGEKFDEYVGYFHSMGNVKLTFKKNGEKTKIFCKDMWGFLYKDVLFRVDNFNQPTCVMSTGKIIYYENGIAHLEMIRDNKETGDFTIGYYCYVSKNLNSDIIPMPSSLISDAYKKIRIFKEENPQYSRLFDCIEKDYNFYKVRACVAEYEK
jgi:hypothetical protein